MDDERIVFTGTLQECAAHFWENVERLHSKRKDAEKFLADMFAFCDFSMKPFENLAKYKASLFNERFLKLSVFMRLIGYEVLEMERVKPALRNFYDLIAFGLIDIEKAVEMVEFSDSVILYRILVGKNITSDKKLGLMWDIWKARQFELQKEIEITGDKFEKYRIAEVVEVPQEFQNNLPLQTGLHDKETLGVLPRVLISIKDLTNSVVGLDLESNPSHLDGVNPQDVTDIFINISQIMSATLKRL